MVEMLLPANDGAGPLDAVHPALQDVLYEEADNLEPDTSLADPTVNAPTAS